MKLFYPKVFKEQKVISALFTESNREFVNKSGKITGLNLGYNTEASDTEVDHNFITLFSEIEWEKDQLALANQVHGTDIKYVSKPGVFEATDGFVSDQSGITLGIRVADCAAILAGDPKNGVIGAFHAGWKGAAGNILPKGINKMIELGADTTEIQVYISPCISLNNFEVGEEVASKFPERFVDRSSFKKPHVDLKGFLLWQMLNAGINQKNIDISMECTVQDDRYYSYRRERDKAGRMLGLIKLNK